MARKPKISEEDSRLFRDAVRGIRPLRHDRIETGPQRPVGRRRRVSHPEPPAGPVGGLADLDESGSPVTAEESLLFVRPGIQHNVLRKLRRGQFRADADLDLHGMNVEQAREALVTFLHEARGRQWRWLRIIHGKGYRSQGEHPVLKTRLNGWLQQHEQVLAFCSAQPADGGTGAVYVLIRNRR